MHSCAAQFQWTHNKNRLHLRLREHCGRRGRKTGRVRERKFAVRLCLLGWPDTTANESQQHDCLNKNNRHAKVNGERHEASNQHKKLEASKEC